MKLQQREKKQSKKQKQGDGDENNGGTQKKAIGNSHLSPQEFKRTTLDSNPSSSPKSGDIR